MGSLLVDGQDSESVKLEREVRMTSQSLRNDLGMALDAAADSISLYGAALHNFSADTSLTPYLFLGSSTGWRNTPARQVRWPTAAICF